MDIRQKKLGLSLGIMAIGMLIGLGWAALQGWGLEHGYPDNTILCLPRERFSDYFNFLSVCAMSAPYHERYAIYLPGAYLFFRPITWFDLADSYLAFIAGILTVGILMVDHALRAFLKNHIHRCLASISFVLLSYPVWICIDRGNIEILMGLLVGIFLVLVNRRYFAWATMVLSITICMKLYTVLLLALFFRPSHYKHIVQAMLLLGAVSLVALSTFSDSPLQSWHDWGKNFVFYNRQYLVLNDGIAGSASVWNLVKVAYLTIHQSAATPQSGSLLASITHLLFIYKVGFLMITAFLVFTITLVETQLFRRAVVLLLLITTAAPNGGDYKLIYIDLALVVLILNSHHRALDLWLTALLAFTLVPKKELFLSYLGNSDTGFPDVDIGVVLNPLCILAALAILAYQSWNLRIPRWSRRRAWVLLLPWRRMTLRFLHREAKKPS